MRISRSADAVVVGGGLAGLTAAALLAQAGRRTVLLERSEHLGGRSRTTVTDGFHVNLGPHAWYVGGPGTPVLEGLGIALPGRPPRAAGTFALAGSGLHTMPIGFISLLTTDLLGVHGKFEAARALTAVAAMDPSPYDGITMSQWLESLSDPGARGVVQMLLRIAAYTDAPDRLSAGAALRSLQSVLRKGVRYLDGGWQPIIDALARRARTLGVEVVTGAPVTAVVHDRAAVRGVMVEDSGMIAAADVVLAVDPATIGRLLSPGPARTDWTLIPSRAACLDLALRIHPDPKTIAAFGVDRPLYFSVHSASAALAPGGGAVMHAAKYLNPDIPSDPHDDERELESMVDLFQPGWREAVVLRRFLPGMTVTHAIPTASGGGARSRPAIDAVGVPGIWLAGDWVGAEGMLANAAVASAARAAARIIRRHAVVKEAVA